VRRIEAVTGGNALAYIEDEEALLQNIVTILRVTPEQIAPRVEQLIADKRALEKEILQLKNSLLAKQQDDWYSKAVTIGSAKVIVAKIENADINLLRQTLDNMKQKLESATVLLAGINADKISLLSFVSENLTSKIHAGELVKHIAAIIGGSGGGRAAMAQGGGTKLEKLDDALQVIVPWVKERL